MRQEAGIRRQETGGRNQETACPGEARRGRNQGAACPGEARRGRNQEAACPGEARRIRRQEAGASLSERSLGQQDSAPQSTNLPIYQSTNLPIYQSTNLPIYQSTKKRSLIGVSPQRIEGREKVTGAAQYVDDLQFGPSLLHGRLKRSPIPHGRIAAIDVSRARALPGVRVVITGQDFPGYTGLYLRDRRIFALDRVRFVGEPVAAVAADTPEIAEQAIGLIEVAYEDLPGVFDPEFGASAEAPLLHPELGDYECAAFILPQAGTNISNHFKVRKGDMAAGWAAADLVYEHKYRVPHIQHVPLETHVCIAQTLAAGKGQDGRGKITLW